MIARRIPGRSLDVERKTSPVHDHVGATGNHHPGDNNLPHVPPPSTTSSIHGNKKPPPPPRRQRRRQYILWIIFLLTATVNLLLLSRTVRLWQGGRTRDNRNTSSSSSKTKWKFHQYARPVIIEDLSDWQNPKGHQKYPPLASWKNHGASNPTTTTTTTTTTRFLPSIRNHHLSHLQYQQQNSSHTSDSIQNHIQQQESTTVTAISKTSTNLSFCLLLKDDNDILNEWIAYHYHLWNLRHLIVAIDPSSRTSPQSLLQQWRIQFGLSYDIWNDDRYLPTYFLQGHYDKVPRMIKMEDKNATKWQDNQGQSNQELQQKYIEINNHRYRQAKFLQHCAKTIQQGGKRHSNVTNISASTSSTSSSSSYQKRTSRWMTHIDTDEYIALNPTLRQPSKQQQQVQVDDHSPNIPTTLSSGSLLDFLERSIEIHPSIVNWPCVSMPRILYGSVDDDDDDDREYSHEYSHVPSQWNVTRFETLRWKYHATFDNRELNKQPKVILDATGFPTFNVSRKAFSIHRPNLHLCRRQAQMNIQDGVKYPLVVHHYLGSLERYQGRKDPRRTMALYQQKANVRDGKDEDHWIDGWLTEFVKQHGMEKVSKVLGQYQKDTTSIQPPPAAAATAINPPSASVQAATAPVPNKALKVGKTLPLEEDSFSACLLIKDDNDILNEWIAYHHHLLRLRTLIVAIDPSSRTSPAALLDRWRSLMDHIELWTDDDYMPNFFLQGQLDQVPNLMGNMTNSTTSIYHNNDTVRNETQVQEELREINNHRFRQVSFLSSCVQTLKQQNKTWMIHIDSDEYVTLHPQLRTQNHWRKIPLDPTIRRDLIFKLLKDGVKQYSKGLYYPCVSMPRLLYGSREDLDDPDRFSKVPSGFDGAKLETTRWKYHSDYDLDYKLNGKPKTLLDLSGLPPEAQLLKSKVYSIHRPGLHLCQSDRFVRFDTPHRFPLTINHYVGSWGRYNHRNDARRNRAIYDAKALVNAGKDDDWIDGWLASFVKEHGLATSKVLLSDYIVEGTIETKTGDDFSGEVLPASDVEPPAISNPAMKNLTYTLSYFDSARHMEFSSCLLVKDDNAILNEWIAYHYHVLGLRYMIVAVDSKSYTSPASLLEQWRQFGMEIEEWTDEKFMPEIYFQKAYHLQPRLVKIKKNKHKWLEGIDDPKVKQEYYNTIQDHRFRQITFLASCAKRLREQGRTWMIHVDTDEYVVINPKLRKRSIFADTIPIPPNAESSVVPRLLSQMVQTSQDAINYPCISLPRLLFGSVEDAVDNNVTRGFNQSQFQSLRWKYHADFEDSSLNKQPKVIVDVSAVPPDDKMFLENRVFSIHRPSQYLCRSQGQMSFDDVHHFPFTVNHYLGTFERFASRDDLRRNRKLYDQKANVRAGKDDDRWVDSWLPSFVEAHGEKTVKQLLSDYTII